MPTIPVGVPRRIAATGRHELRIVKAAGKSAQVAVYGADGTLLGVCDPDAIQQLADPPGTAGKPTQAQTDANAAQVKANMEAGQQEVAKARVREALAPVLKGMTPRPRVPGQVQKAARGMAEQWDLLLKNAGDSRAAQIRALVANESMRLMISGAADGTKAVSIAKRAAVQAAVNADLI